MMRVPLLVVAMGLSAVAVLAAGVSATYPPQIAGHGVERTAGMGVFADTPFHPRSALVDYETGRSCCPEGTVGDVSVYLFERSGVRCRSLEAAKSRRFFSYEVQTDGRPVPVGRPFSLSSFFQQASFNVVGLTEGVQSGARIVFTRVDTRPGGVWHGTIRVVSTRLSGHRYAFHGSFAAAWCGSRSQ
jgi:hypothetical protein